MCTQTSSGHHDQTWIAHCFFYWTAKDKLKFTDWSEVNRKFGCGDKAFFRQRIIIMHPTILIMVK